MNKIFVKNSILTILFLSAVIVGSLSIVISAQEVLAADTPATTGYVPLVSLNEICGGNPCTTQNPVQLGNYLKGIFQFILGMAGVLAVFMIVLGGLRYMSTDSLFKAEEGKKMITGAVEGLALAVLSYLILNTISPNLLNFDLNLNTTTPPLPPGVKIYADGAAESPSGFYVRNANGTYTGPYDGSSIPEGALYWAERPKPPIQIYTYDNNGDETDDNSQQRPAGLYVKNNGDGKIYYTGPYDQRENGSNSKDTPMFYAARPRNLSKKYENGEKSPEGYYTYDSSTKLYSGPYDQAEGGVYYAARPKPQ